MEPYNDEFMTFDHESGQYLLTEKALLSRGIDLRADLAETETVTPEAVIEMVTRTASDMIYGYIHQFSARHDRQDHLLAHVPSLRKILFGAMLYQAVYIRRNGNLYLSTDDNERHKAIDELAKQILMRRVPELGVSILYAGS